MEEKNVIVITCEKGAPDKKIPCTINDGKISITGGALSGGVVKSETFRAKLPDDIIFLKVEVKIEFWQSIT